MTAARSAKSGTSDPVGRPQILRSCSSCCSRASHFPSRFIRTMRYAQSMGLPNGKTEAWYVLSAAPGAKVALGLKQRLTPQQLREAVDDGSISDLVVWQAVSAGRRHLRARRDDPRDWRGARHCRDPTAQRRDVSSVRSRPAARASYRKRNRGGEHRTGRFPGATEPAHRRTDASRLQPPFRARTDRSGAKLRLVPGSGPRDLASRSQRRRASPDRSTLPQAMPFSRSRTASTSTPARSAWRASWRTRASARFRTCCGASHSRAQRMQDGHRRCRCQLPSLEQRRPQRTNAWKQRNETASACGVHRQSSSAPLRNRDLYP